MSSEIRNSKDEIRNSIEDRKIDSGRGQPHSKTSRNFEALWMTRQRLGVRLSSAAFGSIAKLFNLELAFEML